MYDYVLFDLDGTLIDPKEGITKCVEYALNKFGIKVATLDELTVFIGPPLIDSFMKYYNLSYEESVQATTYYRERFKTLGVNECFMYSNVEMMLKKLKDNNKIIAIATSKPEEFAVKILKNFGVFHYFNLVGGATLDGARSKKSDVIGYVIDKLHINNLKKVVMIGDRMYDIHGAKLNNIDSIGVTYGYALSDELITSGATHIVDEVLELLDLILS